MSKIKLNVIMRNLHRDIGFLVVGLTVVYVLSGITLIHRDTDFLKLEKMEERQLASDLNVDDLGRELRMRGFKVERVENEVMYFQNGTYNKSTGIAIYKTSRLPTFFEKLNSFHKQPSSHLSHVISLIYGILLFFLAISSFWMMNSKSKRFKRNIGFTIVGFLSAFLVIYLL